MLFFYVIIIRGDIMSKIIVLSMFFLLLDQASKLIIVNNIELNSGIEIIPSFFSFFHAQNTGAAFSLFQDSRYFLIVVSLFSLLFIYLLFLRKKTFSKFEIIFLGALLGGILGNLTDRIFHGYVIDFLSFKIIGYNFPIFNLADVFIVCAAIGIFVFIGWSPTHEDNS